MTDATDAPEPTTTPQPPTTADRLMSLQKIDTEADQLTNRRERLPEREHLGMASNQLGVWERDRTGMRQRIDELTAVIDQAEADAAELAGTKQRLEAQMKTVIAPREAEALMHQIATLDEQTDELDMKELEALEEQSDVDDRLTTHLGSEEALRTGLSAADSSLERATSEIDAELEQLRVRRDAARSEMATDVLARYDRIRSSSGVAIAHLIGHRCDGCHIDLSAAEVDEVKDEAARADGVADCPNCGRMLAR